MMRVGLLNFGKGSEGTRRNNSMRLSLWSQLAWLGQRCVLQWRVPLTRFTICGWYLMVGLALHSWGARWYFASWSSPFHIFRRLPAVCEFLGISIKAIQQLGTHGQGQWCDRFHCAWEDVVFRLVLPDPGLWQSWWMPRFDPRSDRKASPNLHWQMCIWVRRTEVGNSSLWSCRGFFNSRFGSLLLSYRVWEDHAAGEYKYIEDPIIHAVESIQDAATNFAQKMGSSFSVLASGNHRSLRQPLGGIFDYLTIAESASKKRDTPFRCKKMWRFL